MRTEKRGKKSSIRQKAIAHFKEKNKGLRGTALKAAQKAAFGQELDDTDDSKSSGIRGFFGGHISGRVFVAYLKKHKPDELEKDEEGDYELNKGLQEVAGKRINRAVLNIAAALPGIAGDIATLSGVGAAVGTGLKVAGSGIKVLSAGVRMIKQKVNDKLGNEKSTAKKLERYKNMVDSMVKHIIENEGNPDKMKAIEREVVASGMTMQKIKSKMTGKGTPDQKGKELYKDWIDALKQR
jgi:hypothetical protein